MGNVIQTIICILFMSKGNTGPYT